MRDKLQGLRHSASTRSGKSLTISRFLIYNTDVIFTIRITQLNLNITNQHSFFLWKSTNEELFFTQYLLYDTLPVNKFKAQTFAFANEIYFTELR